MATTIFPPSKLRIAKKYSITQPMYQPSGKSAMNLLLRTDPVHLPPLPRTQPLAIQTSQCLLLSVYYTALFSLQTVSTKGRRD